MPERRRTRYRDGEKLPRHKLPNSTLERERPDGQYQRTNRKRSKSPGTTPTRDGPPHRAREGDDDQDPIDSAHESPP